MTVTVDSMHCTGGCVSLSPLVGQASSILHEVGTAAIDLPGQALTGTPLRMANFDCASGRSSEHTTTLPFKERGHCVKPFSMTGVGGGLAQVMPTVRTTAVEHAA